MTPDEIVSRLIDFRDTEAWEALDALVLSACGGFRWGASAEEMNDVHQAVMLALVRRAQAGNLHIRCLKAYVGRSAYHTFVSLRRSRIPVVQPVDECSPDPLLKIAAPESAPEALVGQQLLALLERVVAHAIQGRVPRFREQLDASWKLFKAHHLEGIDLCRLAGVSGLDPQADRRALETAYKQLSRIRKEALDALDDLVRQRLLEPEEEWMAREAFSSRISCQVDGDPGVSGSRSS